LPAAAVGLLVAGWVDRRMPVVPRAPAGIAAPALRASATEAPAPQALPGLVPSLLPIVLPVLFISSHTVVQSMTARPGVHLAFGVALQAAQIGPVIERAFVGQTAASGTGSGLIFLFLGFGVASLIKIAQGSSTVAMITTAAMLAAMLPGNGGGLPFHTVYVATAIASGALVGAWMNDSGVWMFSKMGGVTELETVKSWTPVLAIVGV